jgi:GNAT superfamily N-acetyltransferase
MDETERCIAFDRQVTLRGGSERVEIPEGWVVRERALAGVFSLNLMILRSETLSLAGLESLADHWLSDIGHRYVRIEHQATADRLAPALLETGWARQRTVLMALRDDAPATAADPRARPITEDELDTVMLAVFGVDFPPPAFPGLAESLVRAQRALRNGTSALRFGAGIDGGLQSMCTLFMDEGPDGHRTAMVEEVATLPAYRERGLARGVVTAAISAAREWGADTVMVPADADDWPQLWYAKLGFVSVAGHTSFLRRPPGRVRAAGRA